MEWLNSTAINKSDVAKRLGISPTLFTNKLKQVQYKRFSGDELERLEQIRLQIVAELSAQNRTAE